MVVLVVFVGFFICLATGLVENGTSQPSEPEKYYYGFPLIWRIVNINTAAKDVNYFGFFIDWGFGALIASFMVFVAQKTEELIMKRSPPPKRKQASRHLAVLGLAAGQPRGSCKPITLKFEPTAKDESSLA